MLILAHADGLRVYLYQFGQWIHEAAGDRDRTTNGDVVVGKFFTGQLGGRIDGSPLLADNEYLHIAVETQVLQEVFRLTAGRTVTDGHGFDAVSFHHFLYLLCRFFRLADGRVRVNVLVVKQVALSIETYHFATCTEAGIDTHDALLPQRGGQEQLAQVGGKDADGFVVGPFLAAGGKFGFDRRLQQAFVGILYGFGHVAAASIVAPYVLTFKALQAGVVLVGGNVHLEHAFRLGTAHGQQAVGTAALQWVGHVEVVAVVGCFGFFPLHHAGGDDGTTVEGCADGLS